MSTQQKPHSVEIVLSPTVYRLLATLDAEGDVSRVVNQLVDLAQQGVSRPSSWERPWVEQAFGGDFLDRLEPSSFLFRERPKTIPFANERLPGKL